MNSKASVSKELNAKHSKILEGLLKLPENRECADCKKKAPRWASVNLGIYICMQCSGIHRSLGVHISQVRSITLDTWLPEQVAFMKSMGNGKSNSHWEAELPPDYDRSQIEKFIHDKYISKKWASSNTQPVMLKDIHCKNEMFVEGASLQGSPRRVKSHSFDEESLTKHTRIVAPPPTKTRWVSLDMKDHLIAQNGQFETSGQTITGSPDMHNLVIINDVNWGASTATPANWATFD